MKQKSRQTKETRIDTPLSNRKQRAFAVIALLLPFLLLVLLELSLRLFSYRSDLDLVRVVQIQNREFYLLNRNAGARYFAQAGTVIPELHEERFVRDKGQNTRRVFCLGESTMEGFPYEFNATAPSFLKDRLRSLLPYDSIEVINVGLSAVGSFVVSDLMRQLLEYKPDLFVLYLGHNEFYGAYGAGSSIASGAFPWLTRLGVRMLHVRTYLAIRDAYVWLAGHFGKSNAPSDATLMQQMVGNPEIPLESKTYRSALGAYRENLTVMIEAARSRGVPILFSTLVSNERDQPPFVGLFGERTSPRDREEWTSIMHRGDSLKRAGQSGKALDFYRKGVALDTQNATGYFHLALALEAESQFDEARAAFRRAKDLDGLRFRATEDFQQTLLDACRQWDVPCARADSAFTAASPHGLVGHELILEHLHPNIRGYFLLATVWANAIRDNGFLAQPARWQRAPSDSILYQQSMVSAFDEDLGMIKIDMLTRKWPFRFTPDPSPYRPPDSIAAIVLAYVRHQLLWSEARYALAAYYARQGQMELARRECLAVSRIIPFSYQPLLRVADYYKEEKKTGEAESAYRNCVAVEDNPYAHMKLGLLMLESRRDSVAIIEFERGFSLSGQGGMPMPSTAVATGRYLLGLAYARRGRVAAARENLQHALAIEPSLKPAQDVLNELH